VAEEYAFNPDKAKQALAESTYGGPEGLPEIKLTYNSDDPAAQPRIEWIAGQLRDILGINVTLDPTDGTTLTAMRKDPETYPQACIFCSNWFQDYPDPQNWLSVLYTCNSIAAQRISYCNPKFDELTAQADRELDPAKREQLYEQASQILNEDLPLPYMYNLANVFLVKPEVTGYKTTPADVQWPGQWGSMLTVDITR
jgi:oligopeptide transport system substrate-binding protein